MEDFIERKTDIIADQKTIAKLTAELEKKKKSEPSLF